MVILRQKEILKMKKEEIIKKLNDLKLELAKERSNVAIGGAVKNPGRLKEIKRTIARLKFALKE